jgi:hypothetical protein
MATTECRGEPPDRTPAGRRRIRGGRQPKVGPHSRRQLRRRPNARRAGAVAGIDRRRRPLAVDRSTYCHGLRQGAARRDDHDHQQRPRRDDRPNERSGQRQVHRLHHIIDPIGTATDDSVNPHPSATAISTRHRQPVRVAQLQPGGRNHTRALRLPLSRQGHGTNAVPPCARRRDVP